MKFSTPFVYQGVVTSDSQLRDLDPPIPLEILDQLLSDGLALTIPGQSCQRTFDENTVTLRFIGQEFHADKDNQFNYPKLNKPDLIDRFYHVSIDNPALDERLFIASSNDIEPPIVAVEGIISLKDGEILDIADIYRAGEKCGWQDMQDSFIVLQEITQSSVGRLIDRRDLLITVHIHVTEIWDIRYEDTRIYVNQYLYYKLPGPIALGLAFLGKEPPYLDFSIRASLPNGLPMTDDNEYSLQKNIIVPFMEAFRKLKK